MLEFKLGKLAKREDPRTLKAVKYLAKVPVPPRDADYLTRLPRIPMFQNDRVGDCTCAAAGHKIAAWRYYATGAEHLLSDDDILAAYRAVSGYDPSNPETDRGAVMLDVLNYWRHVGVGDHKIGAFVEVNAQDEQEVKRAIWLFGGVYTGLALPASAQKEVGKIWSFHATSAPGSWGGHAVAVNQYNRRLLTCATWGACQAMTWCFWRRYVDECWAVLSEDFLNGNVAPNGFDLATLRQDLEAL